MKHPRIKAKPDDIQIEPLTPHYCQECGKPATVQIIFEVRNAGTSFRLGVYCAEHAKLELPRLREAIR